MTTNNPNRFRISSNFIVIRIIIGFGIIGLLFDLIPDIVTGTSNPMSIWTRVFGILPLLGILYYFSTRKRIDYDDINQILYIVDIKNQLETSIPVENIDKILYSSIGGISGYSYLIIYRDFQNQKQNVRLFPIPYDRTIETIKMDAKLKNPNLVTRNWSVGWNELFD